MEYRFYILKGKFLARSTCFGCYEWYNNGGWELDKVKSLYLMDCIMDYANCDPFDYEVVSEQEAIAFTRKDQNIEIRD